MDSARATLTNVLPEHNASTCEFLQVSGSPLVVTTGGEGDAACGGRTPETVPSILSHTAQPFTQGTGHVFIPKCQLYQDGELLLSMTCDFCKPSGFLVGANDCRCIIQVLHRHFSAFNRTGQPNIIKKLNTIGMCRLMNYSAPGYSHNHQSGPEGENCQEPRTAPPPSPRGPYPRGHLLFPHSSDLVPRFSLSITTQIFKHFCLNYFRTLCVWSVHSFLSFDSLIILLGSLDATAPSCKRQHGYNGLIAKENVSMLPH